MIRRNRMSITKQDGSLIKEGDGGGEGGAFDSLGGTVFTSSHAGIFSPTYGEHKTRKRHRKNKRKQDHKRKKLMGKDKKNGVDRLIDFLYEHSPNNVHHGITKSPVSGMRGNGVQEDMTGKVEVPGNRGHTPYRKVEAEVENGIDWDERQKGISKIESHATMGMNSAADGKIQDAGRAVPRSASSDHSAMVNNMPAKVRWENKRVDQATIQNASQPVISEPPAVQQNLDVHGWEHPHGKGYTEKRSENKLRNQVTKQNDFQNKDQERDTPEDEKGDIQPPRAAGATASMTHYPNGSMQMMEKNWGSGPAVDALKRDIKEPITIPDDEENIESDEEKRVKKFGKLYKEFLAKGDYDPMLAALQALDND